MDKIRFGIVGMGVQGSFYANVITGNPHPGRPPIPQPKGCALSAVCDVSPKAAEAAKKLGVSYYSDWKDMILSGQCDAVILTVPHFLHHEIGMFALSAGVSVLCEKPAGVRASDVRKMLNAHSRSEAALAMVFQQRVNPMFRRIREIIDSGELGQLRRSNWIVNHYWRPDSYYASASWRGTWRGEGGGLLVNQLPHYLDLWIWLCGLPASVYAVNRNGAYRNIDVENDVTVVAEYENGATGVFIACAHDPMGTDRLELDFDKGKIVVEDSARAQVHRFCRSEQEWNESVDFVSMQAMCSRNEGHHETQVLTGAVPYGFGHAELIENFASHILHGTPRIATGEDGLAQVELANAIQLSGWLCEKVTVPGDSSTYDALLNERMEA